MILASHKVLMLVVLSLCSSNLPKVIGQSATPLAGKWKVVRFQGQEEKTGGSIEFFQDGRVVISQKGSELKEGTYVTDETKSPFTINFKLTVMEYGEQKKTIVNSPGIYKFEAKRLILKAVNAPDVASPKDFKVEPDGYANLELVQDN